MKITHAPDRCTTYKEVHDRQLILEHKIKGRFLIVVPIPAWLGSDEELDDEFFLIDLNDHTFKGTRDRDQPLDDCLRIVEAELIVRRKE
jgi:hypothetical protein